MARALAAAGRDVLILERHDVIGSETSSRNSEVIHAGIYYPTGSMKAAMCVRGKALLYEHCRTHNVPHRRLGKVIVAAGEVNLARGDEADWAHVTDLVTAAAHTVRAHGLTLAG